MEIIILKKKIIIEPEEDETLSLTDLGNGDLIIRNKRIISKNKKAKSLLP